MHPALRNRLATTKNRAGAGPITATNPQECVALTPDQFRGCLEYVTTALMSGVSAPTAYFNGAPATPLLSSDDSKVTLLATFAHFKNNPNLSLSFFFRYRAMVALAGSDTLKPWIAFDPAADTYAGFHPALVEVVASLPMDRKGQFDPQAVRDAASKISAGFPQPVAAAVAEERESVPSTAETSAIA